MAVYISSASPSVGSSPLILTVTPPVFALSSSFSFADRPIASRKAMTFSHSRHTISASIPSNSPVMYCFVSVMQAARLSCMEDFAASRSFSRANAPTLSESCFSFSESSSSFLLSIGKLHQSTLQLGNVGGGKLYIALLRTDR